MNSRLLQAIVLVSLALTAVLVAVVRLAEPWVAIGVVIAAALAAAVPAVLVARRLSAIAGCIWQIDHTARFLGHGIGDTHGGIERVSRLLADCEASRSESHRELVRRVAECREFQDATGRTVLDALAADRAALERLAADRTMLDEFAAHREEFRRFAASQAELLAVAGRRHGATDKAIAKIAEMFVEQSLEARHAILDVSRAVEAGDAAGRAGAEALMAAVEGVSAAIDQHAGEARGGCRDLATEMWECFDAVEDLSTEVRHRLLARVDGRSDLGRGHRAVGSRTLTPAVTPRRQRSRCGRARPGCHRLRRRMIEHSARGARAFAIRTTSPEQLRLPLDPAANPG